MTSFDRLRRASGLRVLFVIATLLTSQMSLACAFDEAVASLNAEIPTDNDATDSKRGDGCCSLCLGCSNCAGCGSVAVRTRVDSSVIAMPFFFQQPAHSLLAPSSWTPPTLLRPPISQA